MYIQDSRLRDCLNLAIAILNPREKWPAHVTIAGPYRKKIDVPRALSFVQQVHLLGRGRFDSEDRHTVYLHVGSRDMSAHMEKPDYPDAVPHLSLYSGPDKEISDLLFEGLREVKPFGVFHSENLEVVESKQQYSFNFKMQVDPNVLPETRGHVLARLVELPKNERVSLALRAVKWGLRPRFSLTTALRASS